MTVNFANVRSFLLDNKTIKQTIFKNTFWIALSAAIGKILRAVLIIYIARILGATEYGEFAFALAFVSLFVTFFDLGLSPIVTREFSREREKEKEFSSIFSLRILLGIGTIILILIGSFFITSSSEIRGVIWILAFFSFISQFPEIIHAFLRARQRMEYESWANILQVLLVVGFGFFVIFYFPSVKNISYSYLFSSLIALIPLLIFFHFKIFPLRLSFEINIWKKFLLMSWPLALTSVFGLIYSYIDSVMMGHSGQITQTGWYNAALKVINIILVPGSIIAMSFYPVLSKFSKKSKEQLQKVWNYQTGIMIFSAFPIVVGGLTLAPKIIGFVYDSTYFPSIFAFQILLLMAGIGFLYTSFYQVLIATDQQKKIFLVVILAAGVNVILNLILIPKFSLYGAAIATVITHFLIFLFYFVFTSKFTPIKPLNYKIFLIFLETIFSTIVMYLVISRSQILYLNVFLSVLIGAIVYITAFFLFKSLFNYSFNYLIIKKK